VKDSKDNYRYDAKLIDYINNIFGNSLNDKVFENYITYLKTDGNVSERTVELYVKDLFGTCDPDHNFIRSAEYTFFTFLSLKNISSHEEIDREILRDYIVWLVEKDIAKTSVNRRLSALRSFYEYLLIEGKVKKSPIPIRTHQKHSPRSALSMKIDKRIPVFLTQSDMENLLKAPNLSKPEGQRDRAMIELLYASGLRIGEVHQLTLESINLDNREIRVLGKGSKERIVLMGVPAASAINEYINNARPQLLNGRRESALFLNKQGKRLSMRGMQKLLKCYSVAVGLEKNVHPHILRHTFATHMLDGGADLRVVQELLGHADLSSTQIYTHVTKQQARKVYLTTHPMAQEKESSDGNPL
jgi:site-specific recombinase XerD